MPVEYHCDPDGDKYVTRPAAAKLAGVAPNTINTWEKRGYLKRVPGCPPRRGLYRVNDVIEAEYLAREAAIRTSGSDARVIRHFTEDAA